MALFQKSVLTEYLNSITDDEINSGWEKFQDYKSISNKIRNYKEEEFQFDFLKMIFNDCLGYKISDVGEEPRNLYTEVKNVSDSKKADGAIKKDNEVIAVIELKSTKTKDFNKIQEQAFGYKVNQPKCKYIITSNFEKLRFYINDATDYEEFDLFNLTKEQFKMFFLCLSKDKIFKQIPELIKSASIIKEENITKELYKDYSDFRNQIFNNLVETNQNYDRLLLFNKTQKLLDRFLFILFAEDRNLLPANSIGEIISQWEVDSSFYGNKSLYQVFKGYFNVLNVGRPARGNKQSIFAYNGGLFAPDELLDSVSIDDEILLKHSKKLSVYDFESDVSVNILGHIFEHSLSEIEDIQNEIAGIEADISKRKEDGIYYTPRYVTKYIVENTLGKLCDEKKILLEINEKIYAPAIKRTKERLNALDNYREWLLNLTICDPACGSGAFLNQALNFLIDEHKYIDELSASYNKDTIALSDVKNSILENNLFGVDVNEESVEIAKLSLWLRTAERGRKLTSLNNNIKCGDSLIDDAELVGKKAFVWEKEFPEVFLNGGFDIIIGNPPYVSNWTLSKSNREMVNWLSENYKNDLTGHWDLFVCFISISIKFLKPGGYNSFILPTSFLKEKYGKNVRDRIIKNQTLIEILDFGEDIIFENVARQTFIYNIKKTPPDNNKVKIKNGINDNGTLIAQDFFSQLKNSVFKTTVSEKDILVYNKIKLNSIKLGELTCVNVGVVAHSKSGSPISFKKDDVIHNEYKPGYKKYITGPKLSRYSLVYENEYLDYDANKEYFHRPKFSLLFDSEKIILRRTSGNNNSIIAYYDNEKYYTNDSIMHLIRWNDNVLNYQKPDKRWNIDLTSEYNLKYILSQVCSKINTYYFSKFLSTDTLQGAYSSIYPEDVRDFPIPNISLEKQNYFISKVDEIQSLSKERNFLIISFQNKLMREFESLNKLSKNLNRWYDLSFNELVKELKRKKLAFKDSATEDKWEVYFSEKKQNVISIIHNTLEINNQIDCKIYEHYNLNEEEIKIIENS